MKRFHRIVILLIGLIILLDCISGMSQRCATVPTEEQISYTRSFELGETRDLRIAKGIIDIPVQIYMITDDKGQGGFDVNLLKGSIEELNEIYIKANIRFIHAGPINTIKNSKYFHFNINSEDDLAANNEVSNALNLFIPKTIKGGYYGYTYHPEKVHKNRMIISHEGLSNGSTLPHEMGHFFGLYHTHGKGNVSNKNREPISRNTDSNNNGIVDCYETGDDLCDTPADPNMGLEKYREYCLESCEIESKIPAPNTGEFYEPLITNIMCYNKHSSCRREFTPEQLTRISQTARNERKSLRKERLVKGKIARGKIGFFIKDGSSMPLDLDINLYRFKQSYTHRDHFYFEIENSSFDKLYMTIVNMDTQKKINKVYPTQGDLNYIASQEKVNPLNGFISLDRTVGKEYTCILLSFKPLNGQQIVDMMETTQGTFTQRLYKSIGSGILPLDNVEYREGEKIDFHATLTDLEILPIMIEMDHGS